MSLIACRECGKEISSDAVNCPHCGAGTPKAKNRKDWIIVIGIIAAVAVLLWLISRPWATG